MPHLRCEYSAGLESRVDLAALGHALHGAMVGAGVFPLAGIRVRFVRCDPCVVGDPEGGNAFLALELLMAQGRSEEAIRAAGERVFAVAKGALAEEIANERFMLSLDVRETDPRRSWKANEIHARLARR
ncbi:5-carboxymethyl-2-hydroxymuconate isomerase [Sagittula salina]|uniref:5-carboxymethyl-2-hydroxymuconate isomerase n=1 Tax=Sagittula salina TaxID=2820268 RepID=A0A940MK52_9RHOB|nr:5-carboxymethyl-2-hydroxymuconate isomerase [Sagittula salina]MBP0481260.1 5-carboxymethyl-2-hydroxymuconate isomerase [Sagittula salina]